MPQNARELRERLSPDELFKTQQHEEPQTPADKRPVRPVPEPREAPDGKEVPNQPPLRAPAAAERNVHIVQEPGGQTHVPPAPEVRDGVRHVGVVEIFGQRKAKQKRQPQRQIGVAREVKIDLQRVTDRARPRIDRRERGRWQRERLLRDGPRGRRQQRLFAKPENQPRHACVQVVRRNGARIQLRRKFAIPAKRPLRRLREEERIEKKSVKAPFHRNSSPVHVRQIRDQKECQKRHANGRGKKRHGWKRERPQQEVRIFEIAKQPGAEKNAERKNHLPRLRPVCPRQNQRERVNRQRFQKPRQKARQAACRAEEHAENQQRCVLPRKFFFRKQQE